MGPFGMDGWGCGWGPKGEASVGKGGVDMTAQEGRNCRGQRSQRSRRRDET